MAKGSSDRIFNARVSPERDPELYACIASRVDGGMTFKGFLEQALRRAYPEEFDGSVPVPAPTPVEAPTPVASADTAEAVPAVAAPAVPAVPVPAPTNAYSPASPGYGLDDRLDANLRRTYLRP